MLKTIKRNYAEKYKSGFLKMLENSILQDILGLKNLKK